MTIIDRRHPRPRRARLVAAVLTGLVATIALAPALNNPLHAQEARGGEASTPIEPMVTRIIPLKHADVEAAMQTLGRHLASMGTFENELPPSVSIDRRINALIISASTRHEKRALEVISAIDVPVDRTRVAESSLDRLSFYDVSDLYDRDPEFLERMIRAIVMQIEGPGSTQQMSLSYEGMLSLHGGPELHAAAIEAIASLREATAQMQVERPSVRTPSTSWVVELTILSSGDEDTGRPVGGDMAGVVAQLSESGMTDWREIGRTSVIVSEGDAFLLDSTMMVNEPWGLRFSGDLSALADDHQRLEMQLSVSPQTQSPTSLSTRIDMKPDRTVVLGLTPMLDIHTAFVVELSKP